jgi:hypothetical protein
MDWSSLWTLIPPLVVLVGLLLWLEGAQRQSLRLDSTWGWLGPGLEHQGSGRAWRGRIGSRRIEVTWLDRSTTICVSAHPRLQATFRRASAPGLPPGSPEDHFEKVMLPGGFLGWGPEPDKLESLVQQGGVREALQELLGNPPELRQIRIEAQEVSFFARSLWDPRLEEQDARRWTQALLVLAHAAESETARSQPDPISAEPLSSFLPGVIE